MHARLVVGDTVLMDSDSPPEHHEQSSGFSVSLSVDNPKDAARIVSALAQIETIQATFW